MKGRFGFREKKKKKNLKFCGKEFFVLVRVI